MLAYLALAPSLNTSESFSGWHSIFAERRLFATCELQAAACIAAELVLDL